MVMDKIHMVVELTATKYSAWGKLDAVETVKVAIQLSTCSLRVHFSSPFPPIIRIFIQLV